MRIKYCETDWSSYLFDGWTIPSQRHSRTYTHAHSHTQSSAVAALMWTNKCAWTHMHQRALKHTVTHIKQTERKHFSDRETHTHDMMANRQLQSQTILVDSWLTWQNKMDKNSIEWTHTHAQTNTLVLLNPTHAWTSCRSGTGDVWGLFWGQAADSVAAEEMEQGLVEECCHSNVVMMATSRPSTCTYTLYSSHMFTSWLHLGKKHHFLLTWNCPLVIWWFSDTQFQYWIQIVQNISLILVPVCADSLFSSPLF